MKRREAMFAAGATLLPWPVLARSPQRPMRLAWLFTGQISLKSGSVQTLLKELNALGYVEGRDVTMLFPRPGQDAYLNPYQELLAQKPDIWLVGDVVALQTLKENGNTQPVVITWINDPVAAGFASSLAHPGGNVTGASGGIGHGLFVKRLELLRSVSPSLKRVGVLLSDDPNHAVVLSVLEAHGREVGVSVISAKGQTEQDLRQAIASLARQGATALIVLGGHLQSTLRRPIAAAAQAARLPAISNNRSYVLDGLLLSYGPSGQQQYQLAARYVDKIARGAKPGDLPIEQPTTFELLVNRKTAEALGIKLKQDLLLRADEVIE